VEPRYLEASIGDLAFRFGKMAFVSGPRQCGKTTLARRLMEGRSERRYGNWDDVEFRRTWVRTPRPLAEFDVTGGDKPLLVLDEIHKAKGWKRTLKGLYDTLTVPCDILVTGSAKLDVYRRGGESLLGRYTNFRLHPFTVGESERTTPTTPEAFLGALFGEKGAAPRAAPSTLDLLFRYGGFPEPFLRQSDRFARIWRRGRTEKIVREDLRDLSRIPELSQVEMLVALLPERAASPLSLPSLRRDLEVTYDTVKRWTNYLKELYYLFEVKPFSKSVPRSLKKEGKLYLWDWSEVESPGARFENLVACHLLKAVHFWTDTGEGDFDVHYVRNREKREIDFLVSRDRRPWLLVECKLSETSPSAAFRTFVPHLRCPFVQLVKTPGVRAKVEVSGVKGLVVSAAPVLYWLP
jgi:hypothetical protein